MNSPRLILILVLILGITPCLALDITTRSGANYKNCKILEVQPDQIRIMHSGGVTSIPMGELPEPLQKQYHYDAEKAAAAKAEREAAEKRSSDRATSVSSPPTQYEKSSPGERAFDSIRVANLEEAHRWLVLANRTDPEHDFYLEVDRHIQTLAQSLNNDRFARQNLQRIRPEIDRILRNASVADRPNVLMPNDNSNQVRAREMRAQAEQMQREAQQQIDEAQGHIESELRLLDAIAAKQAAVGAYSAALDLTALIENVAAHSLSSRRFRLSIGQDNRIRLQQHAEAASKQLVTARADVAAKKLFAAQKAAEAGAREEPGRYELQRLSAEVKSALDDCGKILAEALMLKSNKQYEQSLERLKAAQKRCVDHPDIERLSSELAAVISEKEKRLAKAKTDEDAGDLESSFQTYDIYGMDDAIKRLIPKLAKLREDRGDFLGAYALYEQANMTSDLQRIRELRDKQTEAYERASTLTAQGKFDDAISIFGTYRDSAASRETMLRKAAFLEGEEKFEEALQVYAAANAPLEVSRVRLFLSDRKKMIEDAINLERAANFDGAIELFRKANAKRDVERVAGTLARDFEKKQDFESAAAYFEMAGLYEEAGRIRKSHDLTRVFNKRTLSGPEIFKRCAPACVTIISGTNEGVGLGSGFFVGRNGYILTNRHVVEHAREIKIITSTNRVLDAKLVGDSETPDLALLQAKISNNPVLDLGDSDEVETGAHVSAIGTPKGCPQSFTAGNISNTDREKYGNKCFQISVLINHGNSGGPLLDDNGRVVGVNTFGEGTLALDRASGLGIGSDIQGINYAIKINEAKHLLNEIRR